DALNQLTKVQYPSYTEELYYDRAGNRTKRTAKGVEELYKYDPRNRLTEYTKGGVKTQFTYDNAGNLLKDDKAKYTYDAFNRTEKVETFDGHVQINRYDAEGLRHEMEEDGRLVQFIFRGDEIVTEEKDSSIIRYIRGYDLIASDAESARTYYHYASDEMSSITHIVGTTHEMGEDHILNHYEYDAWGNATVCEETVENRFRFNGQQYDPITQQYYLRARFYNPVIARFTQEDTYRGDGLNLYAYCRNNPVYYVDPSGHIPQCVKDAYKKYRESGMTAQEALNQANLDYFVNKNKNNPNCKNDSDVMNRALIDLEIHQAMQKYQMLTNQFDDLSRLPSGKDRGNEVHKNVDKAMTDWIKNRNFDYINVETETYYKGGKPFVFKYWWQSKNASRVDLHITEKADSNNPMINSDRHIIGDIKTGEDSYKQEQMARNQANVVTNTQPIGKKGNKLLYPEVNVPNVQHVQFKPVPPGKTMPRFEFSKNPQVGDYNVPGITEKRF
ncbi:MAG: hypothetical protein K2O91_01795, partial [Lachnospiraceae bacterium]|nr:hypothetical protein [Lachnospiraceae bacterium]